MGKWNDTNEPLAYLLTFRTYGTWLPGDKRGSIDKFHNHLGGARSNPSPKRQGANEARLKSPPFLLNANSRRQVEAAIREVCAFRNWLLVALNVRTNHAHAVVAGKAGPDRMLNDLKAYSTRRLREHREWEFAHSPWVDKGSKRYLWTEIHIARAADYVVNGQGRDLPEFD